MRVRARRAVDQRDVLRGYAETRYGAKSWSRERRVAARIEATRLGLDIRYRRHQLDGRHGASGSTTRLYCARGQAENLIKLHKTQLASDRTSCRSPLANQVRLILHTAAYWLMLTVRDAMPRHPASGQGRVHHPAPAAAQDRRPGQRDRFAGAHCLRGVLSRGGAGPRDRRRPRTGAGPTQAGAVPRQPRPDNLQPAKTNDTRPAHARNNGARPNRSGDRSGPSW